jgi:uncharacterized protein Veg
MNKKEPSNRYEVIELIKAGYQRNKPQSIILNDTGENIIQYPGKRLSEKVTFDEAVKLHKTYPDVLVIQFADKNSPNVLSNPIIIDFTYD